MRGRGRSSIRFRSFFPPPTRAELFDQCDTGATGTSLMLDNGRIYWAVVLAKAWNIYSHVSSQRCLPEEWKAVLAVFHSEKVQESMKAPRM